jgi:rod shape-determining protein MreC
VGAIVAVALAVSAFAFLLLRNSTTGQIGPEAGLDDGLSSAAQTAQGPVGSAASLTDRLASMWTATGRVRDLERENAELREWRAYALALAERNARYETLLHMPRDGMVAALQPGQGVTARLVLDMGGPFRRTLLANAGADHGVKTGFIASNENGLVGRVVSVGRRSSRVLLLDDYNSRIPVMGQSSRVRAILVGEPGGTPELEGLVRLSNPKLQNVVGLTSPREWELIVTSGDGGLFPAGIPVGYALSGPKGEWRVRLGVSTAPIDYIRLTPFTSVAPPESEPAKDAGPPPPPSSRGINVAAPRVLAPPPPTGPRPPPPSARVAPDEADAPPVAPAPSVAPPGATNAAGTVRR